MPYIRQEQRDELMNLQIKIADMPAANAGELNFLFTLVVRAYIEKHGLNYQKINDVVGALESAKAEFQRRIVGPYEDKKIVENGDV
jgi:hypothetical protein